MSIERLRSISNAQEFVEDEPLKGNFLMSACKGGSCKGCGSCKGGGGPGGNCQGSCKGCRQSPRLK